ncbi:MAG: acylneuraminate cytidylyltransferase family protein, partial [Chlorobaculum sp.]|nr:acylneuraminate cytidylyltransferase family protein [Chlorobaculum sp.]
GEWNSVNFDYRNRGMRQDRPSQYIENGSIYLFTPSVLRSFGNRIGQKLSVYPMEFWQTWEIDTIEEVDLVEFYLTKKGLDRSFIRS